MAHQHPLNVIQVETPCSAAWDEMSGDAQRRFCAHCNKFVHDLSAMSADEAERLICNAAGEMCVRFTRGVRSGRTLTLDYRQTPKASRARVVAVVLSILTSTSVTATWLAYKALGRTPPLTRMTVAGKISYRPSPRTPAATQASPVCVASQPK